MVFNLNKISAAFLYSTNKGFVHLPSPAPNPRRGASTLNARNLYWSCILVFFLPHFLIAETGARLETAQKILDNLYLAAGQYIYEIPTLELAEGNQRVAAYLPSKNTISIDEKALEICASLGNENENALAFLIGHELAHALQTQVRSQNEATNFLAYDQHYHATSRTEKVADIQGVFTGYLAGYGMQKAIPLVLEKIYETYGLKGKKLPNYPTYEERLNSAKEVIEKTRELIDLFEVSQYLVALEKYKLASNCLQYILEYYQGSEIYNNLGISYLMTAMVFFDPETDLYSYPLALENSSLLKKIDLSRGPQPLNDYELKIRQRTIRQALIFIEKAIETNKNLYSAKKNKACALNLMRRSGDALQYLESTDFSEKEKNSANYQLVFGNTQALLKNEFAAASYFNKTKEGNDPLCAASAAYNYKILKRKEVEKISEREQRIPAKIIDAANAFKTGRIHTWKAININKKEELFFRTKKEAGIKYFSFGDGFMNYFTIIISNKNMAGSNFLDDFDGNPDLFFTNLKVGRNCFFIKSEKEETIVKCGRKGKVLEIAKFIVH